MEREENIQEELVAALRPLVAIVNGARVGKTKRESYLTAARAVLAKIKETPS